MAEKLFKTFAADTQEELDQMIKDAAVAKGVTTLDLTHMQAEVSSDHSLIIQNQKDIDQLKTESHDLAVHINELTADKMNKELLVNSYLFELLDASQPAGATLTTHVVPTYDNKLNLWHEDLTVDLTPISDDAHLYFIWVNGVMYSLPILKYDNTSDPVRLANYSIQAGKGDNILTFSVIGENANLEMKAHVNPQDVTPIKLIKFF